VTSPRRIDPGHELDARLVAGLRFLKQLDRVAPAVLAAVHLLVTLVADEHQVLDAIEVGGVDARVSSRAIAAERPNVSPLSDVHPLLRDGRLPQRLVAAGELAATRGTAPKHVADRLADGSTHFTKHVTSSSTYAGRDTASGEISADSYRNVP
jgi:hypothetical protein